MYFTEAVKTIRDLEEITGISENDLAFKAAVIMLYCTTINDWDPEHIVMISGYSKEEVGTILINLIDLEQLDILNGLILEDPENEATNWIEFFTIAFKAAGIPRPILN